MSNKRYSQTTIDSHSDRSSPITSVSDHHIRNVHGGSIETLDMSPIPSPSASAFLRTAVTLEGLSRQLGDLKDDSNGDNEELKCCCGSLGGCSTWIQRDKMEEKLKLSGEIGDALLQRYEALEKRHQSKVEAYEKQLEAKRNALAESLKRISNLEKANTSHLVHYAEMSKKNEALEKRYTQALHTQTLTQQSLTHVRAELTNLRSKAQRTVPNPSNADVEDRIIEAESRYEEMRENYEVEERKAKDEARRRKRAEARIEELQGQLDVRMMEIQEVKEARAKDARELLANAKERLTILHNELSETFNAESPADAPEYQKTLEDLVASNALLKHDASELSLLLNDSREEVRTLKDELDELRANGGYAGSDNLPSSRRLASELLRSHTRTESTPNVGNTIDRGPWARMSVHVPPATRTWERDREHARKASLAPSFTSSSSYANDIPQSPGLGMGHIGEYGGIVMNDGTVGVTSPTLDGRESPKPIFRSSPSGGIGYVLNGVPKSKTTLPRPPVRRSMSENRPRPIRVYSPNQPGAIAEWGSTDTTVTSPQVDEPLSPGASEYFRSAEASRKRRSILLSRGSMQEEGEFSSNASNTLVEQSVGGDLTSPMSDGATSPHDAKRVHRRTLLLLTKSIGVQTEPTHGAGSSRGVGHNTDNARTRDDVSVDTSTMTSPRPNPESETSSLHELRTQAGAGVMTILIDHLAKFMTKLRSSDIPTLNKRLKKQHLPGDVSHLSRSTLRNLQQEVSELRSSFKGVLEIPLVSRKEFTLLLKLLKDVFGELVELQAVVNDVTIDPSLAKKLQKEAYRDDEEEKAKAAGGLGWIAAPITKFFVTPAQDQETEVSAKDGNRAGGMARVDKGKLQAATIRAPKLQASTSATTTHVSVEFGGAGIVRRATPAQVAQGAQGQMVVDVLPPSPDPTGEVTFAQPIISSGAESLVPPAIRPSATLRPQKSRANRNELLGIFAGANTSTRPISPSPWTVVPAQTSGPIPQRQLRATSSQYFVDKTIRASDTASRKKLSAAVDAVIDRTAIQIDESDPASAGSFEPPLLERTLRPRGLSDSSIRSTFIAHETEPPVIVQRAPSYGVTGASRGYLGSFASRFFPSKSTDGDVNTGKDPDGPEPASTALPPSEENGDKQGESTLKPIPISPNRQAVDITSNKGSSLNHSLAQSHGQGQGLIGRLASSISAVAEEGEEGDDDELRADRLKRGLSRMGTSVGAWK